MQQPEVPTDAEISRAMSSHLIRHAFRDRMTNLDGRTALIVIKHQLFDVSRNFPIEGDVIAALDRRWEDRPNFAATGPLFAYHYNGKRVITELRVLLLAPELPTRRAAFAELQRLLERCPTFVAPEAAAHVLAACESATRDNGSESLASAIAAVDLLDDDYFYHVAGLRESAALNVPDALRSFLHFILFPKISTLRFLNALPVWSPDRQASVVESLIRRIVTEADSLPALLRQYFRYFGHLPLADGASAGAVVDRWHQSRASKPIGFSEVSTWAEDNRSPLAEYHRCEILSRHPEWLDDEQRRNWYESCISVIRGPTHEGPWKLRLDLARHYCRHLETLSPAADGERVAAMAWWLSEHLAASIGEFDKDNQAIVTQEIAKACRATDETWLLGRPEVHTSRLRYATLFSASPWSTSLLAALSQSSTLTEQSAQKVFGDALGTLVARPAFTHLAFPADDDRPTYAFERTTSGFVNSIRGELHDVDLARRLERIEELTVRAVDHGKLADAMCEWNPVDEFEELWIAHELRLAAFCAPAAIAERFWQAYSNPVWREKVFLGCKFEIVELVWSAAIELECIDNEHEWRIYLPHFFALACGETGMEDDRQRLLFAYVVSSSLAANGVSAVQRVLSLPNRLDFADAVQKWRERIQRAVPIVPSWIAAKLRGLKAVLHV